MIYRPLLVSVYIREDNEKSSGGMIQGLLTEDPLPEITEVPKTESKINKTYDDHYDPT